MPKTEPDNEPIVAAAVLLLIHVPPPGDDDKVFDEPTHETAEPVTAPGAVFTVTGAVVKVLPQPFVAV